MADNVIELRGISKTYGSTNGRLMVEALDSVGFRVGRGEFVAVMGPSGSGKSTLMNILGCLDRPTAGQYWLEGADVSAMGEKKLARVRNRHIGFVFQSFHLLPRLSAIKNVELPMVYAGVTARARGIRAEAALERVGLSGRAGHRPCELSGGQRQRVAIARALINDPSIILADEPTGNLDSAVGGEIMALFESLGRGGATIIIVTHEPEIACRAGRVITFRDGRVAEDKTKFE